MLARDPVRAADFGDVRHFQQILPVVQHERRALHAGVSVAAVAADHAVVAALGNVTMLPGCSDKRFAKMMRRAKRISQAGAWYLADLRQRYQRQIPESVPRLEKKGPT